MEPFFAVIYLREMKHLCEVSLYEYGNFSEIIKSRSGSAHRAFFHLENFAVRAGGVSKMLWPQRDRKEARRRGDFLREILSIEGGHPSQSRALRNHIEHWDERLDYWAKTDGSTLYFDQLIGEVRNGIQIGDRFITALRHYDPSNGMAYFGGEQFNVQEIADGCTDILKRLDKLSRSGEWHFQCLAL